MRVMFGQEFWGQANHFRCLNLETSGFKSANDFASEALFQAVRFAKDECLFHRAIVHARLQPQRQACFSGQTGQQFRQDHSRGTREDVVGRFGEGGWLGINLDDYSPIPDGDEGQIGCGGNDG